MTQRELAARLNQNQDTQPQRKAAEAARRGNTPEVQCIHRDTEAAGKLKCSCSQQPVVYACSNPFVFSGYCTPTLPTQPGDGPIGSQGEIDVIDCSEPVFAEQDFGTVPFGHIVSIQVSESAFA